MNQRWQRLMTVLLLLLLTACGEEGILTSQQPERIVAEVERTIDLGDASSTPYFWLSPDGTKLLTLVVSPVQAKLYDLSKPSLTSTQLDLRVDNIDPLSVSFSPDSSAIVYSEDFLRAARQSDIHLYDFKLKTARSITSYRTRTPSAERRPAVLGRFAAWSPLWSADSKAIYYVTLDDQAGNTIYSLSRYGTEAAHKVVALGSSEGLVSSFGFASDGKRLVYVLATTNAGMAGIYVQGVEGPTVQLLDDRTAGRILLADGLAVIEPAAGEFVSSNKLAYTLTVAGREGEREFIKPFPIATTNTPPETISGASTHAATFSPDGRLIAHVTDNRAIPSQPARSLWLYDPVSKQAAMVYRATGSSSDRELLPDEARLSWSADNRLAINGEPGKLLILKLKVRQLGVTHLVQSSSKNNVVAKGSQEVRL